MQEEAQPSILDVWSEDHTLRERPTRLSPLPLLNLTDGMTCRDAAAMLGINAGTLQKWRNGNTDIGLHYAQADRIAVRSLGTHPSLIWGKEWWRI
jgi:hypothetical protein